MQNLFSKSKVVWCCWNFDNCGGTTRYVGEEHIEDCGAESCVRDNVEFSVPGTPYTVICDRSEIPKVIRTFELTGEVRDCYFVDLKSCGKTHVLPALIEVADLQLITVLTKGKLGDVDIPYPCINNDNETRQVGVGQLCQDHWSVYKKGVSLIDSWEFRFDSSSLKVSSKSSHSDNFSIFYVEKKQLLDRIDVSCTSGNGDSGPNGRDCYAFKGSGLGNWTGLGDFFGHALFKYTFFKDNPMPESVLMNQNGYDQIVINEIFKIKRRIDEFGVIGPYGMISKCRRCFGIRKCCACGYCKKIFCSICETVQSLGCSSCRNANEYNKMIEMDAYDDVRADKTKLQCVKPGGRIFYAQGETFEYNFLKNYITSFGDVGVRRGVIHKYFDPYYGVKLVDVSLDRLINHGHIVSKRNQISARRRERWEVPFGYEDVGALNYFQNKCVSGEISPDELKKIMMHYGIDISFKENKLRTVLKNYPLFRSKDGKKQPLMSMLVKFINQLRRVTIDQIRGAFWAQFDLQEIDDALYCLLAELSVRLVDGVYEIEEIPVAGITAINENGKTEVITKKMYRHLTKQGGEVEIDKLYEILKRFKKEDVDLAIKYLLGRKVVCICGRILRKVLLLPGRERDITEVHID